nr:reverse transcriptase domain-containing protein [Tanacetum cinerariifolium]
EAWDRFKDLLRKCPHHSFSELHQINTFYNSLTQSDQDSLNVAAGGNLLIRTPRDSLTIIENKLKANQQAFVKAAEETCMICGGPHPYNKCLATDSNTFNAFAATGLTIKEQNPSSSRSLPSNTIANPIGDLKAITTRNDVSYNGPTIPPTRSPLPKEVKLKTKAKKDKMQPTSLEISTPLNENCLAVLLKKLPEKLRDPGKFLLLCDFPKIEECLALADLGASINLMPLSVWKNLSLPELTSTRMTLELANRSVAYLVGVAEDVFVKFRKFYFLADFIVVDYDVDPRVPLILRGPFLRMARALIDVHDEEMTLRVNDQAITLKVRHTSRYSRNYYEETVNQVNVIDVACVEYAQEVLGFLDSSTSGIPTPSDPIIASFSPSFTPFEGSDFILEEIKTFLRTPDELSNLDDDYYDTEGDILYLEKLLNVFESPSGKE